MVFWFRLGLSVVVVSRPGADHVAVDLLLRWRCVVHLDGPAECALVDDPLTWMSGLWLTVLAPPSSAEVPAGQAMPSRSVEPEPTEGLAETSLHPVGLWPQTT